MDCHYLAFFPPHTEFSLKFKICGKYENFDFSWESSVVGFCDSLSHWTDDHASLCRSRSFSYKSKASHTHSPSSRLINSWFSSWSPVCRLRCRSTICPLLPKWWPTDTFSTPVWESRIILRVSLTPPGPCLVDEEAWYTLGWPSPTLEKDMKDDCVKTWPFGLELAPSCTHISIMWIVPAKLTNASFRQNLPETTSVLNR